MESERNWFPRPSYLWESVDTNAFWLGSLLFFNRRQIGTFWRSSEAGKVSVGVNTGGTARADPKRCCGLRSGGTGLREIGGSEHCLVKTQAEAKSRMRRGHQGGNVRSQRTRRGKGATDDSCPKSKIWKVGVDKTAWSRPKRGDECVQCREETSGSGTTNKSCWGAEQRSSSVRRTHFFGKTAI